MKVIISIHSFVDVITNSSTELFTVTKDKSVEAIRDILRLKCTETNEMEWYNEELTISDVGEGKIEIYSFLNSPDWFYDFINKTFNIIDYS